MTPEKRDELRRLCDDPALTPGPWESVASEDRDHMSWVRDPSMPQGADSIALVGASELETEQAIVDFIASAREALPALLDEVERLQAALEFYSDPRKYRGFQFTR